MNNSIQIITCWLLYILKTEVLPFIVSKQRPILTILKTEFFMAGSLILPTGNGKMLLNIDKSLRKYCYTSRQQVQNY